MNEELRFILEKQFFIYPENLYIEDILLSLKKNENKRSFSKTSLQKKQEKPPQERIYVIQRHEATRLHWDLRLEMNGVLKSWAIPKEPPQKYGVKRLAVQVEDHPLEYATFHGLIPEGVYGAGSVEIWDRGTYQLLNRTEDKIEIIIYGEKLRGAHALIRTRWKDEERNWLFFKTTKKTDNLLRKKYLNSTV